MSILTLIFGALFTVGDHNQNVSPVKVDLYFESLCPYCHDYFLNQLYPTYQELKDIMDVSLYPFGNAKYSPTENGGYNFTCQHGPDECRANTVLVCAQKHNPRMEMDFTFCLLNSSSPATAGEMCAEKVDIDFAPIESCANSVEGEKALHGVALKQEKLNPSLYFVPWILVDNTFSEEQVHRCQTNMKAVVCDAYKGPTPAACAGQVKSPLALTELVTIPSKSYKDFE